MNTNTLTIEQRAKLVAKLKQIADGGKIEDKSQGICYELLRSLDYKSMDACCRLITHATNLSYPFRPEINEKNRWTHEKKTARRLFAGFCAEWIADEMEYYTYWYNTVI